MESDFCSPSSAQVGIASDATFWQTISHDFVFQKRQLLNQAD
jgi:hypothetical protein